MKHLKFPVIILLLLASYHVAFADTLPIYFFKWGIPSPNSFPFGVAVMSDGYVWFTEMRANKIGRLNSKTGRIREFPLYVRNSEPRDLVLDKTGYVWFTAGSGNYIGRLDPCTGETADYPLPEPDARTPQDIVVDDRGNIWFTVQMGNYVGRLDSKTGKITLLRLTKINSQPSGMTISPSGTPFFCESGTNRIGKIDPGDLSITEYVLPEGARPRRIVYASDGNIYYTDYRRGFLGQLNPNNGKMREWSCPAGARSAPYSIAAGPDGMIWYNESGVNPDTIVRFDPLTQTKARWALSKGDRIRGIAATPQGEIFIICSGSNTIGLIRIERNSSGK